MPCSRKVVIPACRQGRHDLRQHLLLLVGQALRPLLHTDRLAEGIAEDPALQLADQPLRQQIGDGLAGAGIQVIQLFGRNIDRLALQGKTDQDGKRLLLAELERKACLPAPCLDPSLTLPGIGQRRREGLEIRGETETGLHLFPNRIF